MTQEEMQKQILDAVASEVLKPTNIVLGDMVDKKFIVEPGGIGEQNNYYGSDGSLLHQENDGEDDDDASEDEQENKPEAGQIENSSNKNVRDPEQRPGLLKMVFDACKEKMGEKFQPIDWFYIYKMMVDNYIYEDNSYKPFEADLKKAGIPETEMPPTDQFFRKYDVMKQGDDYRFPHWEVTNRGRQSTLDRGISIARIAHPILF